MLNGFLSDSENLASGEKIGIRNVHNRLQLKYGAGYGISYKRNDDGGIEAMIRIPVIPLKSEKGNTEEKMKGDV